MDQPTLFDVAPPLPQGFRYQADFIAPAEEQQLVHDIEPLPFQAFDFHGYEGKRRVVSFGGRYDFAARELQPGTDIPAFLLPLRERAAAFAGLTPADLPHVLVTEYPAGAAIGWHRDKPVFAQVIGVSLLSPCRFRLRRGRASRWQRAAVTLAPRSAYILSGPARTEWEHSIPPVDQRRYSITFRSVAGPTSG